MNSISASLHQSQWSLQVIYWTILPAPPVTNRWKSPRGSCLPKRQSSVPTAFPWQAAGASNQTVAVFLIFWRIFCWYSVDNQQIPTTQQMIIPGLTWRGQHVGTKVHWVSGVFKLSEKMCQSYSQINVCQTMLRKYEHTHIYNYIYISIKYIYIYIA